MKPNREPGIEHEPHLQKRIYDSQPDELPFGMDVRARPLNGTRQEDVEHTVWDEPALSTLAGTAPKEALNFKNWFEQHSKEWNQGKAWGVTVVVAFLIAPLWALASFLISGVFLSYGPAVAGSAFSVTFQPLIEEICKIAVPLWIVEKRPYFFTGWFQIFITAIGSATLFAAAFLGMMVLIQPETLDSPIYIFSFFLFHVATGALASIGLEKVWRRAAFRLERPQLTDGAAWFMAAFLVHLAWSIGWLVYNIVSALV